MHNVELSKKIKLVAENFVFQPIIDYGALKFVNVASRVVIVYQLFSPTYEECLFLCGWIQYSFSQDFFLTH